MSHAYLIEIEQDTVGLVIREAEGYRFYATRRSFSLLERNLFDTASAAHHAVLGIHGPADASRSSMVPLHSPAAAE
ncbi:MAG: hypothetical protein ACR652_08245 [Methylocystis sp.]|uniref:hypothetical protein n=1 Tax=Methylocystis sp. TaxID=1911079 RepID=UPI003DA5DC03